MQRSLAAVFIATLAASASAHAQQASAPVSTQAAQATSALTGCVSAKPDAAGNYTFTQSKSGSRFRLVGKSMSEWAGKPVEIASAKGVSIRTGLVPSPNVAAQAGHIDPAAAAVASQPGAATTGASETLPEFRVNKVRPVEGSCK